MDFERELAEMERHLVARDPRLAEKFETFERITAPPPAHGGGKRRALLLAALVCLVIAVGSALAAGAATAASGRPAQRSQVVRQLSGRPG
ncbi:DUF3040 domain-containing protein [Streptomyces naganishii]|uniref:DUF3040 domain-containing protein n=1 Tax=Streptomyces naganishii JCM 4654 TaxID=1306179 RepID=A0A918Y136_9ACTN|nr:DUF3040 domain-containing protein [Streptomyces naganishii]GHD87231.1 hypothetical protein GCM10010508_18540 [Streptomyces naganishii JCM 4654]